MYKSFSMELAGRTLTVDIGRVAKNRPMAQHLCVMGMPRYLLQPRLTNQEKD